MNKSLQRLIALAPPPEAPGAVGSIAEWPRVEMEIGAPLPQDFKDYISTYGAGQWADFFGIMNPFYRWKHPQMQKSWKQWMEMRLGSLAEDRQRWPKYTAPFLPHPSPDGLLAFGYDDNGGTLCWQMCGAPDNWPIVCLDGKFSERFDRFTIPLTGLIAAIVGEEFLPNTFPPDLFPIAHPAFRPYTKE